MSELFRWNERQYGGRFVKRGTMNLPRVFLRSCLVWCASVVVVTALTGIPGMLQRATASSREATPLSARSTGNSIRSTQQQAIAAIFGDRILSDNVLRVLERTAELPESEQLARLSEWVLANESEGVIRLSAAFTATQGSVSRPVDQVSGTSTAVGTDGAKQFGLRGGRRNLVCPAVALVRVAAAVDQLDGLRRTVSEFRCTTEVQQRNQLALLILTDIARSDFDSAIDGINVLLDRLRLQDFADLADRWPETLVAVEAIHHPELFEIADQLLQRMLREQVRPGRNRGPDSWDRLIFSLSGELAHNRHPAAASHSLFGMDTDLQHWVAVDQRTAATQGSGFPVSHWHRDGTTVSALSHHQNDYLYFQMPLTGTYQVECDVSGFDYRDTQLYVAGMWAGPRYTHREIESGTLRAAGPVASIEPRLAEIGDWARFRVSVSPGNCSMYVNGRLIHQHQPKTGHAKWLAVRVPFHSFGSVRDVCISGDPIVPGTVQLSEDPDLGEWTCYFGGSVGERNGSDWYSETADNGERMIVGRLQPAYADTGRESLLQYQRPMIEDGVIEYDFFYSPDQSLVHPAVGRLIVLLDDEHPRIHRLTDGPHDFTALDPLNAGDAENKTSVDVNLRTLLKVNDWNRMEVHVAGREHLVMLNGTCIYRGHLSEQNNRRFGLFHYSGSTEARVRNIEWTGSWQQTVPDVAQQQLRDMTAHDLDEGLLQLGDVFEHDFTLQPLPADMFTAFDADVQSHLTNTPAGLQIDGTKEGTGYRRFGISPRLAVEGDFDLIATFEDFRTAQTPHSKCDAIMQIALTDQDNTHHAAARAVDADPGSFIRHVVEHQVVQLNPVRIHQLAKRAEEVTSGRLRLARRGDMVYSLLAAGDSDHFRVVHFEKSVDNPSHADGIRLQVGLNSSVDGDCTMSVVWKKLVVRAEKLSGPAVERSN
jgi:hypothetical protein